MQLYLRPPASRFRRLHNSLQEGDGMLRAHAMIGAADRNPDSPVREPDVERVLVGGRVDGDGLDVQLVQRANDAHGDLASVRDENTLEHG